MNRIHDLSTDAPEVSTRATWFGVFVAGYALFDLLPVVLTPDLGWHGLRIGDVVDAPLVSLPVVGYVILGQLVGAWKDPRASLLIGVLLIVFVQGHAVHLAANAIAAADTPSSSTWATSYFLDEHWGHTELHLAIVLLAVVFVVVDRRPMQLSDGQRDILVAFAAVYGLLLAADAIEGQTVPVMLPAGVVLTGIVVLTSKLQQPVRVAVMSWFFGTASIVMTLSLLAYGAANRGYPELLGLPL